VQQELQRLNCIDKIIPLDIPMYPFMDPDLSYQHLPKVSDSFLVQEESPRQPDQRIVQPTFSVRSYSYRFFIFLQNGVFFPKSASHLEEVSQIIELLYAILSCWLRLLLTGLRLICDVVKN